ncbi:ATP-binding protein [Novosphingobium sp. SG707]|uniref:sensor histidine kinase n=1 Tax=Novosphingobium sp. SG707 TaxID=2586996 RepID=UPI001446A7D7|nr:ATP-binding protein [Novosphingobium sp. SG707]NKI99533.1 C4-dicarboxylate-specific signal transduction histidine kinase [Novosphingobium sp. SG707]
MMAPGGFDRFDGDRFGGRFDPSHVDCPHDPVQEFAALADLGMNGEDMWIDVIRKMDDVYADLVASQTALEERNIALERTLAELDAAHRKLRQTQQQLLTSEKMAALGRLVAGVAHELNNPISFVFGNMYALKRYGGAITQYLAAIDAGRGGAELAALREKLKIDRVLSDIGPLVDGTLEGAERVRDIVQDLRRFSASQREPLESFNLVRLVHTAADWVLKALRDPPELHCALPERLEISSRKGQLHQILVNLVQNAADALRDREGGVIDISAAQEGDTIALSVADNGPGVTRDHQDKIFEPFFTTKPIGAGTGLGLYVSYTMAGKLGGSLDYADAPGGGAVFTLRLPLAGPEGGEE